MTAAAIELKPRKSPVQSRSFATIEALHEAVIQVLTREGLNRCTTTRVAERAGMSVGSLYQYYPNRDALLAAVLEKHLTGIAVAVENACRESHDRPTSDMVTALVTAFLTAKLSNPDESKALYAIAADLGGSEFVPHMHRRMVTAITAMLQSAPDVRFENPTVVSAVLLNALVGPVRALLEGHVPVQFEADLEPQLIRLLTAYLQTYAV